MESSSHDYERKNNAELEFIVNVRSGASVELEFTYKVDKRAEPRDY